MPQLLSQILKPFVNKNVFVGDSSDGLIERAQNSRNEKEVLIKDSKLAEVVRLTMNMDLDRSGRDIGMVEKTEYTRPEFTENVHLYMPKRYTTSQQTFYFPPLPEGSQIQNLAVSSRPDVKNEDWVLAVKYSGSKLKLYRHNNNNKKGSRWIDIKTTHECISPYSSLMYSMKDQRFYVPTPGSKYLCSFDLNFKEKDKLEFVELRKTDDLPTYELMEIDTYTRTDHLVESPSGKQFLISWYYENDYNLHNTIKFTVYRVDEKISDRKTKFMYETDIIGDLSIFLGRGEAFCVKASTTPGLKPNCIYFMGHDYGVFDITTKTRFIFSTREGLLRSTEFPSWPHPLSLTPN